MRSAPVWKTMCAAVVAWSASGCAAQPAYFATRVVHFAPAPGQFVNHPQFSDPARALGPPVGGGTLAASHVKVVTLGGFGGTITLAFEATVLDNPRNPLGLDAVVFGNAMWVGGNPNRRFAEAAVIEISLDENGNGVADDAWYVIPGSHLPSPPAAALATRTWDSDTGDPTYPPANPAWVPAGRVGVWATTGYMLPDDPFNAGQVLTNPNGPSATDEGVLGYADLSPTLILGDFDADNMVDDPGMEPAVFYTVPDDPRIVGVGPGFGTAGGLGGGGDAFDIAWAVDPETGAPARLRGFDFIRITTAVDRVDPLLGEVSAEIGGVARVRALMTADWNGDGVVNSQDFFDFLMSFFEGGADFNGDGATNSQDFFDYVVAFFAE